MLREIDVIRAWRDVAYRASLSEEERASLPPHPAGLVELDDLDLGRVSGRGTGEPTTQQPKPTKWGGTLCCTGCCCTVNPHQCGC